MVARLKDVYCVKCGAKNQANDKKCVTCGKKLNQKDHLLRSYLLNEVYDNGKSEIDDKLFDAVKAFLITHLYGTSLTATVVFAITSAIVNGGIIPKAETVSKDAIRITQNIKFKSNNEIGEIEENTSEEETEELVEEVPVVANECDFKDSKKREYVCQNGYELKGKECIKSTKTKATETLSCADNYKLDNEKCISNTSSEPTTEQVCELVLEEAYYAYETGQYTGGQVRCYNRKCSNYKADGTCNATQEIPVDYTTKVTCASGLTKIGNLCYTVTDATKTYSCDTGALNGKSCVTEEKIAAVLECPTGYAFNKKCNVCVKE